MLLLWQPLLAIAGAWAVPPIGSNNVCFPAIQDLAKRQALQPALADEAEHLSWMYSAALYGTGALHATDGGAHGDFEHSTGCLFALAT